MAPEVLAQAVAQTLFWVPSLEENQRRVREYYEAVKVHLPGERAPLGRDFFLPAGAAP